MMKKIKEYMAHPYTRGDYWGAVAIAAAIYAVVGAAYVVYIKVDEFKRKKNRKNDVYSIEEDEEA